MVQLVPDAHACAQPLPEHEKLHVAPGWQVCLHRPPEQKKSHVAPAGHVCTQPPCGQFMAVAGSPPPASTGGAAAPAPLPFAGSLAGSVVEGPVGREVPSSGVLLTVHAASTTVIAKEKICFDMDGVLR